MQESDKNLNTTQESSVSSIPRNECYGDSFKPRAESLLATRSSLATHVVSTEGLRQQNEVPPQPTPMVSPMQTTSPPAAQRVASPPAGHRQGSPRANPRAGSPSAGHRQGSPRANPRSLSPQRTTVAGTPRAGVGLRPQAPVSVVRPMQWPCNAQASNLPVSTAVRSPVLQGPPGTPIVPLPCATIVAPPGNPMGAIPATAASQAWMPTRCNQYPVVERLHSAGISAERQQIHSPRSWAAPTVIVSNQHGQPMQDIRCQAPGS